MTKARIRTLILSKQQSDFTVVPLGKKSTWIFLSQKTEAMIFQAEGSFLIFFVLPDFMWRSYADCHLDSGS
jgi:hypothetical protein